MSWLQAGSLQAKIAELSEALGHAGVQGDAQRDEVLALQREHGRVAEVVSSLTGWLAQHVPRNSVPPYAQVLPSMAPSIVGAWHRASLA